MLLFGAIAAAPTIAELEAELGVTIVLEKEVIAVSSDERGDVRCQPPYAEDAEGFMEVLAVEGRHYGPSGLRKVGVARVMLCRELTINFRKPRKMMIDGALDVRTEQSAGAFAWGRDIYIDVFVILVGRRPAVTLHHEIFHVLDRIPDARWSALNSPDFRYGTGGIDRQHLFGQGEPSSIPGFVSEYSTASPAEDKAELYERMITAPKDIQARAKKDPILEKKMKVIREMLEELGLREEFWKRATADRD